MGGRPGRGGRVPDGRQRDEGPSPDGGRERFDADMRGSEDPFRLLVESVKDYAILMLDPDGCITSWNRGAERLKGYRAEEIVGEHFSRLYTPDDIAAGKPWRALEIARTTGRYEDHGTRARKDGSTFHAHVIITALYEENGDLRGFGKVTRDVTGWRKAEAELKRLNVELDHERERLQQIFTLAPSFMATLRGDDFRFESANPHYLELLGRGDIIGKPVAEVLPEAVDQGFVALLDSVYRSGEPFIGNEVELFLRRAGEEGPTRLYLNFVYQPLRDASGAVTGVFAHGVDVTEQVVARRELETLAEEAAADRNKLEAIVGSMNEALLIFDARGRLVKMNRAGRDRLGYRDLEQAVSVLVDSERNYLVIDMAGRPVPGEEMPLARALRGETYENLELLIRQLPDDREWIGSFNGTAVAGADGTVSLAILTVRDVTGQKRDEEERRRLLENERQARMEAESAGRRLRLLADVSTTLATSLDNRSILDRLATLVTSELADWCAIGTIGERGAVDGLRAVHSDPKRDQLARRLQLGLTPTRDVHGALFQALDEGEPLLFRSVDDRVLGELSSDREERALLRQLGTRSVLIAPLVGRHGVVGAIFMARDGDGAPFSTGDQDLALELARRAAVAIENARLYQQTRELNQELERRVAERTEELESFSYSVSHDLRAPLRAIDGFSRALLEDHGKELEPGARAYLHRVRSAADRMAQLIEDLLKLARVSRDEVWREPVDLSELAGEVVDDLRKLQPAREVSVEIQSGLAVEGDRRLMKVLLENLLGNAWKFTSKRDAAHIAVGREETPEGAAFFVRDNGAGFDMARAGRLFGPFQRLHGADEFEGTGIGLATARRIINRHEGRIWAESEIGRGATFYFTVGE